MSIRRWLGAVLVSGIFSASATGRDDAAAADDAVAVAYAEYRDAAVTQLAARDDDEAAVAAVLMLGMGYHGSTSADSPLARELLARIDVSRSTSPMALLRLLDDRLLPVDERATAVARLLEIDRTNAAVWVHAVELAVADAADAATIDGLIADAAVSARTYTTYFDATMRTLFHALRAVPLPGPLHEPALTGTGAAPMFQAGDYAAAAHALGIAMAVAMPHAIRSQCDRLRVPHWHRRSAACISLGQTMSRTADTLIAETMGFALWRAAAGEQAIAPLYRAARWRRIAHAEWASTHYDLQVAEFIARMQHADRTEIESIAATLRAAGIALQPPADWQPPR